MAKPNPTLPPLSERNIARFWSYIRIGFSHGCWEWAGAINGDGYGCISVTFLTGKRTLRANRVAYTLYYKQECGDLLVRHKCDNRRCVNPLHLELGTHEDNTRDMVERGRVATGSRVGVVKNPECRARGARHGRHTQPERTARGERCGASRLTEAQAREILSRFTPRTVTYQRIASEYGIAESSVKRLLTRMTWRHLT